MMIPTLLGIILAVFLILRLLPGSNDREFSSYGEGDWLDEVFETLDIHETLAAKYIRYVYNVFFKLDLGNIYSGNYTITEHIAKRLRPTLLLTFLGLLISVLVGIPSGILAAVHHNKRLDQTISLVTVLLSSMPTYCLAIILVTIFSVELRLLPVLAGRTARSYIMPTLVVAAGGIAMMTRMTRSAVLETMGKQYITVLRARGLSEGKIMYKHVLKNALAVLVPTVNNLTVSILCGTIIAENFFNIPGLWQLIIQSVNRRNQKVVLGGVIVISLLLMSISLAADMLSAAINPQVRAQYKSSGKKVRRGKSA